MNSTKHVKMCIIECIFPSCNLLNNYDYECKLPSDECQVQTHTNKIAVITNINEQKKLLKKDEKKDQSPPVLNRPPLRKVGF